MEREVATDENSERLRYVVRILFKHPDIDPESITKRLGLTPRVSWLVGSPWKTPDGTTLPRTHQRSAWGYSIHVEGKRSFSQDVAKIIDALEPHAEFLSEIVNTNGTVELIIDLP